MADAADTRRLEVTLDEIVALCKRRGFIFPSSEIYGGVGSTYDYGHYGVLLKNNVKDEWWRAMLQERDDIVAIDSAIIQHPRVWEASGHLGGFTDPMVDCKTCKLRFRADKLEDAQCGRKPSKHPGEGPDCELTEAREFNLMFETTSARSRTRRPIAYLRPETAQGIFINFKNVLQFARKKPPFGIAQIGKSFRNEITTGNFIFRTREFEQMEMEFFVPARRGAEVARALDGRADALVHRPRHPARQPDAARPTTPTSSRTTRARPPTSSTCSRWAGRSSRGSPTGATSTSTQHADASGEKLEYFDQETGRGLRPVRDRAGRRRRPGDARVHGRRLRHRGGRGAKAHRPAPAPQARAGQGRRPAAGVARRGCPSARGRSSTSCARRVPAEYDEGGSIGKRYRRQDEIGTPWGVTVDGQTIEDDTVTLRDRDTLEQERVPIDGLADRLAAKVAEPWTSPKLG